MAAPPKERMASQPSCGSQMLGYMATNEEWAVPATFDERRFVVLEVSGKHRVRGPDDLENRAYWDAIYSELKDGGREAFLHDMARSLMNLQNDGNDANDAISMSSKRNNLRFITASWDETPIIRF